jgi:hypothetical protein
MHGQKPGSDRGGEEDRLFFFQALSEEELQFLEAQKGLGHSQRAEVAWLERRYQETKDEGFLYQELDVTHANGGSICGEAYRYPDRDPNRDLSTLST